MSKWVYEKATGKWLVGFRDPSIVNTDPVNYALGDLGDGPPPDPVLERATATGQRRKATGTEQATSQAEADTAKATARVDAVLAALCVVIAGKKASDTAADVQAALVLQLTGKV